MWGCTIQIIYAIQIAHSYTCHQDQPREFVQRLHIASTGFRVSHEANAD